MRLTPLLLLLAVGCSHASSPAAVSGPPVATPVAGAATTWSDGMVLSGTVTIPAGSTVSLAPAAHVRASKGARLVVAGTLLAPAGGSLEGTDWEGLAVERGGVATLTGVALSGAVFDVAQGSTLTLTDVKVSRVSGSSLVKGTLIGDHLTYDKGAQTGIVVAGPASVFRVKDSTLLGNGQFQGDMVNTDDAGELTVSSSVVKDNHCAFHLIGVDRLSLTHLSIHDNAYGFMAYGSNPAKTQTITSTDVYDNRDFGLLESPGTKQGTLLVDGGYWGRNGSGAVTNIAQITGKVARTHPAPAPR